LIVDFIPASEGVLTFSDILRDSLLSESSFAFEAMVLSKTVRDKSNGSFKLQKLIVIYSKTLLHFHEDCGIFCEGEWEQHQRF